MSRSNALSALGKMGWGTHFLIYPISFGLYVGAYKPYQARSEQATKDAEMAAMAKAKQVDPDNFHPFSPIPFSNNAELKYVFANCNMRNYVNADHMSVQDYHGRTTSTPSITAAKRSILTYNWSSV